MTNTHCPTCHKKVVQDGQDGTLKIRTPLLMFKKGSVSATVICKGCGSEVPIDVRLGSGLIAKSRPSIRFRRQG